MHKRQTILVVDDDPMITEAVSALLERRGRTTIACYDVHAAEILMSRHPITHLVTDVQFSGEFGFEGLHFLSRVRSLAPLCRIVLMTGHVTDALVKAAKSFGAFEVLAKPFGAAELENALDTRENWTDSSSYEIIRFPPLEEILRSDHIIMAFQPIVRMTPDGVEALGYEALTRVYGQWLIGGPETLFDYAERLDHLAELNLVALRRAVGAAVGLPGAPMAFINLDPLAFRDPSLVPTLKAAALHSAIPLSRIVLEVTERSRFIDADETCRVFDELRALGLRFALDDHASAYSHLAVVNRIRPSFMKISNTFGTDFEKDPTRTHIVRHIVALAHDLGCETILEGIESRATASAAAETGVDLMQGYYFGRPSAASQWVESMTTEP